MEIQQITNAQQLQWLRQEPTGSFRLANDIDMADTLWTPVDFAGTLEGCGYTIHNLKVESGENAGLFGILSGKVTNLHLRGADVTGTGGYAGILAGVIEGATEGCTVTGQLRGSAVSGAMAGKVTGKCIGGNAVTAQTGPHTESGLCADVWMSGKNVLVGEVAGEVTGLWRDNTYALSRCSEVLQNRRRKVVDYMRSMATVAWQIDQDQLEYIKNRNKVCVQYQLYLRGRTYLGIPYAHSGGGMARFLAAMAKEENGVYTTLPDLKNGEYYVGEVAEALAHEGISPKDNYGFTQYMGNDCSSTLSWAWRQVSSVDIAEGGCYGRYSGNMVPTAENEKAYGILPLSDFYAKEIETQRTVQDWGETAVYEGYAKALPGDGLCGVDSGGHVLMLSYDPMVIRSADGAIDPEKSFVVTIEQGAGLYDCKTTKNLYKEELPDPLMTTWRVDYRYYFRNLAYMGHYTDVAEKRKHCGCDHVYLAFTMQALQKEDTPAVTPRVWVEGSKVCSNFYIAATQMEGAPIHTQISHDWHIYREFPVTAVDLAKTHGLKPGNYTAKVHLSNEQVEEVTFTVE